MSAEVFFTIVIAVGIAAALVLFVRDCRLGGEL